MRASHETAYATFDKARDAMGSGALYGTYIFLVLPPYRIPARIPSSSRETPTPQQSETPIMRVDMGNKMGLQVKASNDIKTAQVAIRFALRMIILSTFAVVAGGDVSKNLASLLLLSAVLCLIGGTLRRDALLDSSLTYWDEAAMYGLLFGASSIIAGA